MEEEKLRGKGDQSVSGAKDGELLGGSNQRRPGGDSATDMTEGSSSGRTPTDKETLLPDQKTTNKTDSDVEQSCGANSQTLSTQQSENMDRNSDIKHEKRKSKWEQVEEKTTAEEVTATEDSSKTESTVTTAQKKYSLLSHVGKRKGGKPSLKTGTVKKPKTPEAPKDPWSKYLAEVEKYKAHVCGDEDKSRPLVK
ncbi:telomerase RNA component interacting RNase-like [Asterias rubens]|uniref:telomerase RNA component interacting RNase-like n=1 Tax=Asterias rubens TaxID=7604 RepID=UPI001455D62D|nr:telomerase RNA component interacting RNase-like [Asterias rubens]